MGQHWRHPPTPAPARSVHSPLFEFLNLLQSVFRSGDDIERLVVVQSRPFVSQADIRTQAHGAGKLKPVVRLLAQNKRPGRKTGPS